MRGLRNRKGTKWGEKVGKRFREVGDGESLSMMLKEGDRKRLEGFIKRGVKIIKEQGSQKNWGRIEKSNYCKEYGEWKKEVGREKYWEGKVGEGEVREQWARMRWGSIGREGAKGFKNSGCSVCVGKGKKHWNILGVGINS